MVESLGHTFGYVAAVASLLAQVVWVATAFHGWMVPFHLLISDAPLSRAQRAIGLYGLVGWVVLASRGPPAWFAW